MGPLTPLLLAAALQTGPMPLGSSPDPNASMNLAWDDCYDSGAGGSEIKSFACDTNTGDAFRLIASVRPPQGITQYVGSANVFQLQAASWWELPQWWRYGGCRISTSLTVSPAPAGTSCPDLESSPSYGGIDYDFTSVTGRARLRAAFAIEPSLAHPLDPSLEQTLLVITIDRRRTVGLGNCSGCSTPMCIVWESVMLDQAGGQPGHRLITQGERFWAVWQNPSQSVPCPAATPATTRTWGQLKSLYR